MTDTPAVADRMDRMYRSQRHFYDFTRKYYLLGRDRLIYRLAPPPGGRVLEIGCGTARNLAVAARAYPEATFFGVDISAEMLETARRAVGWGQIRLAMADATSFDASRLFGVRDFSRVFLSYSLSMIPDWPAAVERAVSCLAPGGELHIVDFGRQEGLPACLRIGLRRWLSAFHVTPRDELEEWLAPHARQSGATTTIEHPYGGYAQYAVVRRPRREIGDG